MSLALEKCKKRVQYSLSYSGTSFCPPKVKITQFPGGFCLDCNILKTNKIAFLKNIFMISFPIA